VLLQSLTTTPISPVNIDEADILYGLNIGGLEPLGPREVGATAYTSQTVTVLFLDDFTILT